MNYELQSMNYSVKRGFEKQKIHLAGRHRQILRDKYNQPPPGINKTIYFSVVEVITQPGAEKLQEGKIYFELVGFCLRHIITRLAKEINERR